MYRWAEHTVLEPLTQGWPAWWCTVAPLPSSFHVAGMQVPLLESFVEDPRLHVDGSQDESLFGAAIVHLPLEKVEAARALLAATREARAHSLALAQAVPAFEARLLSAARGESLQRWYG